MRWSRVPMIPGGIPLVFRFRSFHLKPSVFSSFIFFHIQVCLSVLSSWFDYFQLCLIANYLLCISFSFLSGCLFGFSLMFNRVSFGVFGLGSFFHLDLFLNFFTGYKALFPFANSTSSYLNLWSSAKLQTSAACDIVSLIFESFQRCFRNQFRCSGNYNITVLPLIVLALIQDLFKCLYHEICIHIWKYTKKCNE